MAEQVSKTWKITNQSEPNPTLQPDGPPCLCTRPNNLSSQGTPQISMNTSLLLLVSFSLAETSSNSRSICAFSSTSIFGLGSSALETCGETLRQVNKLSVYICAGLQDIFPTSSPSKVLFGLTPGPRGSSSAVRAAAALRFGLTIQAYFSLTRLRLLRQAR